MRRLSLSDTIFYNLGECYITGAFVLDGPCDPAAFVAEIEGVVEAMPAMAERPRRIGVWTFAERSAPLDLTNHIAIVRDRTVTRIEQVVLHLDRLRRSRIEGDRPPWRVFILNPLDGAPRDHGPPPLSALLIQSRHGLADAMRGLQILARMARYEPAERHVALAARLPVVDPALLAGGIDVHDVGLSAMQVPRRGMSRDGDASERLAAVAASIVADAGLFPHARPLRGNIGRTRIVRRRISENGLGNHIKMVTVSTGAGTGKRRWRIPGLARAQNLQLTQWLVALAPRRLARRMMRIWYANFDAIATLVPVQRHLVVGRRHVTAAFGVPPLWGPVPLAMIAFADGEHYHLTVMPGKGFTADRDLLLQRIGRLLNPETATDRDAIADVGAALAEGERRSAQRSRYGQGVDGRSSSPVNVPASVKSP